MENIQEAFAQENVAQEDVAQEEAPQETAEKDGTKKSKKAKKEKQAKKEKKVVGRIDRGKALQTKGTKLTLVSKVGNPKLLLGEDCKPNYKEYLDNTLEELRTILSTGKTSTGLIPVRKVPGGGGSNETYLRMNDGALDARLLGNLAIKAKSNREKILAGGDADEIQERIATIIAEAFDFIDEVKLQLNEDELKKLEEDPNLFVERDEEHEAVFQYGQCYQLAKIALPDVSDLDATDVDIKVS